MLRDLPLLPERASTFAGQVDALFYFLAAVSGFFTVLIFSLLIYFAIRYRRGSAVQRLNPVSESRWLEVTWTVIPFGLTMVMFFWGANLYFSVSRPPGTALEILAVGKQWMWKFQHPQGRQEINELHVPIGRPVKLTLASDDVIHSFFVPAFRVKRDVVPGRYTTTWFEATKTGEFHLFCAEYCGTQHSGMVGRVVVMSPAEYEKWLSGGVTGISVAAAGERLFQRLGCAACHLREGTGRGPSLVGIFGKRVSLERGRTVIADEDYIRESILNPTAKVVGGYQPIMPTFKGQVSEEGLLQIIAYIKSLKIEERTQAER